MGREREVSDPQTSHVGRERDVIDLQTTHVGRETSRYERVKLATEAKQALVTLKFPKDVARAAVDAALTELGPENPTLERLIFVALRGTSRSK